MLLNVKNDSLSAKFSRSCKLFLNIPSKKVLWFWKKMFMQISIVLSNWMLVNKESASKLAASRLLSLVKIFWKKGEKIFNHILLLCYVKQRFCQVVSIGINHWKNESEWWKSSLKGYMFFSTIQLTKIRFLSGARQMLPYFQGSFKSLYQESLSRMTMVLPLSAFWITWLFSFFSLILTHSFPLHPSLTHENIRKP